MSIRYHPSSALRSSRQVAPVVLAVIVLFAVWIEFRVPLSNTRLDSCNEFYAPRLSSQSAFSGNGYEAGRAANSDGSFFVDEHAPISRESEEQAVDGRMYFDCEARGSACRYFRPVHFFESETGLGHPFREVAFKYYHRGWHPGNDRPWLLLESKSGTPPPGLPETLAYFHVHKVGGWTTWKALTESSIPYNVTSLFFGDHLASIMETGGESSFNNFTADTMEHIKLSQSQDAAYGGGRRGIFTFYRDPVSRFVSQAGQVFREGQGDHCDGHQTSGGFFDCMLGVVRTNGLMADLHFIPASVKIYMNMMRVDAKVAMLHMDHVDTTLKTLGVKGAIRENTADVKQPGKKQKRNVTFSASELTKNTIRGICTLYEVDLRMLASMGLKSKHCLPYYPLLGL